MKFFKSKRMFLTCSSEKFIAVVNMVHVTPDVHGGDVKLPMYR